MNSSAAPLVSICIVTYNHEKYISQCILSVLNQQADFKFEIIIGDDASTDKTSKIIAELEKSNKEIIRILHHKKNIGASRNYITTHNAASGKYIAHLDGDDFWLPGKLKSQIDFFNRHPECSAVYSNAVVIDKFEKRIGTFNKKVQDTFDTSYLLERGNFLNASSLIYRSNLREKILPSNGEFLDYKIHLRCSAYGALGYINKPFVAYRSLPTGTALNATQKVIRLYWEAIKENYRINQPSPSSRRSMADFMGIIFCRCIIEKKPQIAYQWAKIIQKETKLPAYYIIFFGFVAATEKITNSAKNKILKKINNQIFFASR